jgi:predicted phosphohydrolase
MVVSLVKMPKKEYELSFPRKYDSTVVQVCTYIIDQRIKFVRTMHLIAMKIQINNCVCYLKTMVLNRLWNEKYLSWKKIVKEEKKNVFSREIQLLKRKTT